MARHADDTRNRGVAGWLFATVIAVLALVAAITAYFIFLGSDSGSGTVDNGCSGSTQIEVAAGGSVAAITKAADAFNASKPEARGSCVIAHVTAQASTQVADGLINGWSGQANPEPAIWIPDNLADLGQVAAAAPSVIAGHTETPFASSPVVLAVRAIDAAGFPTSLRWSALPAATSGDAGVQLSAGRPLKVALGDPRRDPATGYALLSVLAGATTAPAEPLSIATVTGAATELATLTRQSAVSDSTAGLLDDLATGTLSFTAIPVLEATLAAFNSSASARLVAVYPQGPAGGDQLTAVGVTASWVDATELEGATAFVAYLSSPAGAAVLTQSGLRVAGAPAATATNGINPASPVGALPAASGDVLVAMATAMGLPDPATAAPSTSSATAASASASAASSDQADATPSDVTGQTSG